MTLDRILRALDSTFLPSPLIQMEPVQDEPWTWVDYCLVALLIIPIALGAFGMWGRI